MRRASSGIALSRSSLSSAGPNEPVALRMRSILIRFQMSDSVVAKHSPQAHPQ